LNESRSDRPVKRLVEDRLGARARVYGEERAVLVAVLAPGVSDADEETALGELTALAETAGIEVLATVVQRRPRPHPATFIGRGKVEEVRCGADQVEADVIIVDDELRPAQARNLEEALGRKVIDRNQLIMDIFAQRAQSKEARLQVELAQLRYLLPRLRGWGMALTRTGGGIGTRGPGETQLELDRYKVRRRIHSLEKRLKSAEGERSIRRKKRQRSDVPQVALVGYTNSGKSTLLNALCRADATVEDKLFATLDTLVRRGSIGEGRFATFADTVGFIDRLPHQLIPAFAATLEAAAGADLVLHVIDASRADWEAEYRVVLSTLEHEVFDAGGERPPMLSVLNKIDACSELPIDMIDGVPVSALEARGIDALRQRIAAFLFSDERSYDVSIPFSAVGAFYAQVVRERAIAVEHAEDGLHVRLALSESEARALRRIGATLSPV